MKRYFLTRILALFLSIGLALPDPALALRAAGLEENGKKEEFLRQIGVHSSDSSTAGLEEKGKRGLFGLPAPQADELVRIFGQGKVPENLASTIVALSWLIEKLANEPKETEEVKTALLNARSLREQLEARLETQRKEAQWRMFGRWAWPVAVLLGLATWRGSELFQPPPALPPPVVPGATQETAAPAPAPAPEPFVPTAAKRVPADLTRVEFSKGTVSAALQVILQKQLGPRSLRGLFVAGYRKVGEEYVRVGQDRIEDPSGVVTIPEGQRRPSAGGLPGEYLLLFSFNPEAIRKTPLRLRRLPDPSSVLYDGVVALRPNGSADFLHDDLYADLPGGRVQVEEGSLRLNLPEFQGQWGVLYAPPGLQGPSAEWTRVGDLQPVLSSGNVSFPVPLKVEEGKFHLVLFETAEKAGRAPARVREITNRNDWSKYGPAWMLWLEPGAVPVIYPPVPPPAIPTPAAPRAGLEEGVAVPPEGYVQETGVGSFYGETTALNEGRPVKNQADLEEALRQVLSADPSAEFKAIGFGAAPADGSLDVTWWRREDGKGLTPAVVVPAMTFLKETYGAKNMAGLSWNMVQRSYSLRGQAGKMIVIYPADELNAPLEWHVREMEEVIRNKSAWQGVERMGPSLEKITTELLQRERTPKDKAVLHHLDAVVRTLQGLPPEDRPTDESSERSLRVWEAAAIALLSTASFGEDRYLSREAASHFLFDPASRLAALWFALSFLVFHARPESSPTPLRSVSLQEVRGIQIPPELEQDGKSLSNLWLEALELLIAVTPLDRFGGPQSMARQYRSQALVPSIAGFISAADSTQENPVSPDLVEEHLSEIAGRVGEIPLELQVGLLRGEGTAVVNLAAIFIKFTAALAREIGRYPVEDHLSTQVSRRLALLPETTVPWNPDLKGNAAGLEEGEPIVARQTGYSALQEMMDGFQNLNRIPFHPVQVPAGTLVIVDLSEQPEYAAALLQLPDLGPRSVVLAESAEAVVKAMGMTNQPEPPAGVRLIYVRNEEGKGTLAQAVQEALRRTPGVQSVRILSTRSRADWERRLSGYSGGTSLSFDLNGTGLRVKEILLNLGAVDSADLEVFDRMVDGSVGLGRFL